MSFRKSLATIALVGLVSMASTQAANAAVILTMGQSGQANTVTATNIGGVSTTITATNVPIDITQIIAGATGPAFFTLNAASSGAATTSSNNVTQNFSGTFSITNGATNFLSGSFSDAVFGALGGPSLTLSASQPPDTVSFNSNVIPVGLLGLSRGISLGFANVTPLVGITGTSLSSFTSSVAGTFSANVGVVPEPASLLLLGSGLAALAARARRQKA